MKRNIILTLLLCLVSCLAVNAKTDFTVDGVEYTILTDRENCVEVAMGWDYNKLTSISVPAKVTNDGVEYTVVGIGKKAFTQTLGKTTEITLPSTIEYFADQAFRRASGLSTMNIPASLKTMGSQVFDGCTALTSFTVAEGNTAYSAIDGVLFDKAKKKLLLYPIAKEGTIYTVPAGVEEIVSDAFIQNASLFEISLDDELTTLGNAAFKSLTALEYLDFGNAVVSDMGESVFYGCKKLASLDLTKCMFTAVTKNLFTNCESLKALYLPATVTELSEDGFSGLKSLEELHMQAKDPAPFESVTRKFSDFINNEVTTLYVPQGSKAAYEEDEAYKDAFKAIVEEGTGTGVNGITASEGDGTVERVFDLTGKEVRQGNLGRGVYVVKSLVGGKTVTKKVSVK